MPPRADGTARPGWTRTALAACLFGVAALVAAALAGLHVAPIEAWASGTVNWITLLVGVTLCAFPIWRAVAGKYRRPPMLRGASAGLLVAIAAYPATLILAELGRSASVGFAGFAGRLLRALELSGFLLVTTGFAAIVVLMLVGAILAFLLRSARELAQGDEDRLARRWPIVSTAIALLFVAAFAILSIIPPRDGLVSPRPAATGAVDYAEAVERFSTLSTAEAQQSVDPRCVSTLLTHDSKTAIAVVYLHGLTTCPAQADELARQLFAAGYNVYVPRLPGHGLADRMTDALASVSAEDMVNAADDAAALAGGLGDQVVVVGLSGGGAASMWLDQTRAGVGRTVSIAPFLSPSGLPRWANRAAMNLLTILPNMMILWDPKDIDGPPEMNYTYPQLPTRLVGQFLRLTVSLDELSGATAPLGSAPGLLLNDADDAVNNAMADVIAAAWTGHGATVTVERIAASHGLLHDVIDPRQPQGQIDFVYPIILDMVAGRASGALQ